MVKNPSCTSCKDGVIQIHIDGPRRPYQFKLIGPGRETDSWTQADTYLGFVKTYRNLGVGRYTLFVDSDDSLDTTSCVSVYEVELTDPCPVEVNCNACDYALYIRRVDAPTDVEGGVWGKGLTFLNRNPNTNVSPFVHYQFGRKPYTVELWFQPRNSNSFHRKIPLFYRSNHAGGRRHWRDIITGGSLTNRHVYQLFGLWCPGPSEPFRPYVEFGASVNSAASYAATKPVDPLPPASPSHEFLKIIGQAAVSPNQLVHLVWVVDYADTVGPVYNLAPSDIKMYVNGVLVTFSGPSSVVNTLSAASQTLLSTVNNFVGPIWLGYVDYDHGGSDTNPTPPPPNIFYRGRYSANGVMTNFRYYSRALSKHEIQSNYLQGCRGEPVSCNDLVIWAPLDQPEGGVALEKRYFNSAALTHFRAAEYRRNGGAWVKDCCGQISDVVLMDCPSEECVQDAVLFSFRVTRVPPDNTSSVPASIAIRLYDVGETPYYPFTVGTSATTASLVEPSDVYLVIPNVPAPEDRTPASVAALIATAMTNDAYWSSLGAQVSAIEDTVRVVIPYHKMRGVIPSAWCGKGLFLKAVVSSRTPALPDVPTPGVDYYTDYHPTLGLKVETGKYTVCCAPAECDLITDVEIKI